MIRGLFYVFPPLLILCLCSGDAQTRAAPWDEKPRLKIQHVSFPTEDGGLIYADLYGEGDQGVVLCARRALHKRELATTSAAVSEGRLSRPGI